MAMTDQLAEQQDLSPQEAQKLVNRFQFLLQINASINSTIDIKVLLRKIIDVAALVMNAEASSLALVDPVSEELIFHLAEGEAGKTVESSRIAKGQGIAGWVAEHGEPLIVPDVSQDPRFFKGIDEKSKFVTRSVICVPLKRSGKVIGVLQALNKRENQDFDRDDLLLFQSLSNIAAIAVENSQLYHLLQQTLKQLKEDNLRLNKILAQLEQSENEVNRLKDHMTADGSVVGSLSIFIPPNILQMLANDQKTGALHLKTNDWNGIIYLEKGQIYHAETLGHPPLLKGNMAIYEMMDWNKGTFSFSETESSDERTIAESFMHLIIEGLRRSDEVKVMLETYPMESKVLRFNPTTPDNLNGHEALVYQSLQPGATLDNLWAASLLDRHTFYNAIKKFIDDRILELELEATLA